MSLIKKSFLFLLAASTLSGCAKVNPHPHDPLEGMNREIYGFNRAVDKGLVRPIAYGYYKYTPKEMQAGVHNFFSNIKTVPTIANDLLQFKIAYATYDISRFLINTTIGIGGLFDPAHKLGLIPRQEDFGQTLYAWGLEESMYVVLPLLGPSTVRDTVGMVLDSVFTPTSYIEPDRLQYSLKAVELLDIRANLLRNEPVLESVGIDEYAFIRNAYIQKRTFTAYDGQVPLEKQSIDPYEGEDWLDDEEVDDEVDAAVANEPTDKTESIDE